MGSSTMLDMIGSFFMGGILLLMALRLNASGMETSRVYNQNLILQQNITTLVMMLEGDFRKIGYCKDWRKIPDPSKSIRIADSSRFRFWTDYDNNGTLDSITYYIGPTSQLLDTPNPRDRYLYRQLNNTAAQRMNLGVTQFSLRYRDAENDPITFPVADPRLVAYMEINVAVETQTPYEQDYMQDTTQYQVYWRQLRLLTKNLRNR
jgi:type II secretory pathway component PulJ